ncbi:MAG: tetratricopeptide repeat protein [Opitutales bacterium]
MAGVFSPEDLRLLCYLMARLNRVQAAELLAEKVFELDPKDRTTRLALCSMYLENKEPQRVLENSVKLLEWYPGDEQALYFKAAAYQQVGRHTEAKEIFESIRAVHYEGQRYPYEIDFAATAKESGDWFRAMQAYQRLLASHDLSDELRQPVRDALDTIYRERMDRLEWRPEYTSQGRGWAAGSRLSVSSQLNERFRAGVWGAFRSVHLEDGPVLAATRSTQVEAGVELQADLSPADSMDLQFGVSDGVTSAPVGRFSVRREGASGLSVEMGFDYRESSRDSTTLGFLDARKTRLSLGAQQEVGRRWVLAGEISGLAVELGEAVSWGRGVQANWSLGHRLQFGSPELTLQYVGYWSEYTPDAFKSAGLESLKFKSPDRATQEAVWEGLFAKRVHNQGFNLVWTDRWLRQVHYELTTGAYYAFEQESIEYLVGGQLRFFPRKSIEVFTGLSYSSSTVSLPESTDRLDWRLGVHLWF